MAAGAEGAAGTLPFGDDLIDALTEQMGELNEEQAEQGEGGYVSRLSKVRVRVRVRARASVRVRVS